MPPSSPETGLGRAGSAATPSPSTKPCSRCSASSAAPWPPTRSASSGWASPPAYIDLFWPGTLIVEQKSRGRSLDAAEIQAQDYFLALPEKDRPRFQLVCDFKTFRLTDLERRESIEFPLADLPSHVERNGLHGRRGAAGVQGAGPGQRRRRP